VIAEFSQRFEEVKFELMAESRVANVSSREANLAIRTVDTQQSTLVFRRIGNLRYGLWAASDFVASAGVLRGVSEVSAHQFVGLTPPLDRHPAMQWLSSLGVNRWTILCSSFGAQLAAVRRGIGVSALPRHSVSD
jgi:DNA-binding transcriptional LysR family regulator